MVSLVRLDVAFNEKLRTMYLVAVSYKLLGFY